MEIKKRIKYRLGLSPQLCSGVSRSERWDSRGSSVYSSGIGCILLITLLIFISSCSTNQEPNAKLVDIGLSSDSIVNGETTQLSLDAENLNSISTNITISIEPEENAKQFLEIQNPSNGLNGTLGNIIGSKLGLRYASIKGFTDTSASEYKIIVELSDSNTGKPLGKPVTLNLRVTSS